MSPVWLRADTYGDDGIMSSSTTRRRQSADFALSVPTASQALSRQTSAMCVLIVPSQPVDTTDPPRH